jgi:dihydrodipicolinate synthase/N-acetylneuraminate lyase
MTSVALQPGIIPIVNTPFDAHLDLDLRSLARAVQQCVDDGVVGCVAPAVASEVHKLTVDERKRLLETVVEVAGDRIAVIGGASAEVADDTRILAAHAMQVGCAAVLVQCPSSLAGDPAAQRAYFHRCAEAGMDVLVIQDLDWGGGGMTVETLAELAEGIPAFSWVKVETVPAGVKYSAVLEATGGKVQVMGGWGLSQMIEGLDRGVDAFTPTAINRPFVHVDRLYRGGRRDDAVALFERVAAVLAFCCQHIDVSIHFLKRYCVRRGLFDTALVREPSLPYDEHHRRYGDELIERLISLEDELGPAATPAGIDTSLGGRSPGVGYRS